MSFWQGLDSNTKDAVLSRLNEMHLEHMGWSPEEKAAKSEGITFDELERMDSSPAYELLGMSGNTPGAVKRMMDARMTGSDVISGRVSLMSDEDVRELLQKLGFDN